MVKRSLKPNRFFSREEKEGIVQAIREAEKRTSGEIKVCLERKVRGDLMAVAIKMFDKLRISRTKARNGVLIFFSLEDHRFAVLGDSGIHEKAGDAFWQDIAAKLSEAFAHEEPSQGLVLAIQKIGELLRRHFPYAEGDVNEIRDGLHER